MNEFRQPAAHIFFVHHIKIKLAQMFVDSWLEFHSYSLLCLEIKMDRVGIEPT